MVRGLSSSTPDNLLLGSGAFYKNFDKATDTPFNSSGKAKCLGATDGGGSFAATPEIRQVSVDGAPGPVKGLEVIDGWTAVLTANVKEVTASNVKIALAAVEESDSSNPAGKVITARHDIESDDYIDSITWAGTLADKTTPVYITIKNALCLNGLNLNFTDKNEGVVALTLTGHYDPDDLETPPFEIFYPGA